MPLLRKLRRLPWYAWILIVPWFVWSVSVLSHPIRGGTELPPPMWTEVDLAPVPVEVAAALGPDSDKSDALRFQEWHRPLARSAEVTLQDDPAAAAPMLAELFTTSVGCANSARSLTMYQLYVSFAEKDLDLITSALKSLRDRFDSDAEYLLADTLRDTPPLSVKNAMVGEYLASFNFLDSTLQDLGWKLLIITDLTATVSQLDDAFRSESAEDACAKLEGINPSPLGSLFTYNIGGRNLLSPLELSFCTFLPRAQLTTETVAEKRRTLFDALGSDP